MQNPKYPDVCKAVLLSSCNAIIPFVSSFTLRFIDLPSESTAEMVNNFVCVGI